ncbi:hypothetical protein LTR86_007422 [Recurvomyces mirabilis]|nr:hypothetical protein LTR86_007422 [Recurvomyces mirabilis]
MTGFLLKRVTEGLATADIEAELAQLSKSTTTFTTTTTVAGSPAHPFQNHPIFHATDEDYGVRVPEAASLDSATFMYRSASLIPDTLESPRSDDPRHEGRAMDKLHGYLKPAVHVGREIVGGLGIISFAIDPNDCDNITPSPYQDGYNGKGSSERLVLRCLSVPQDDHDYVLTFTQEETEAYDPHLALAEHEVTYLADDCDLILSWAHGESPDIFDQCFTLCERLRPAEANSATAQPHGTSHAIYRSNMIIYGKTPVRYIRSAKALRPELGQDPSLYDYGVLTGTEDITTVKTEQVTGHESLECMEEAKPPTQKPRRGWPTFGVTAAKVSMSHGQLTSDTIEKAQASKSLFQAISAGDVTDINSFLVALVNTPGIMEYWFFTSTLDLTGWIIYMCQSPRPAPHLHGVARICNIIWKCLLAISTACMAVFPVLFCIFSGQ